MHILFLAADPPWPVDQGDRIRAYHILRGLGSKHKVTLVAFGKEGTACDLGPLRDFCHEIRLVPITRRELYLGALRHPLLPAAAGGHLQTMMTEEIRRILAAGNVDVVYVYQLKMAAHLMGLLRSRGHGDGQGRRLERGGTPLETVPGALDLTDALSTFIRRSLPMRAGALAKVYGLAEYFRLKRWEASAARAFDLTWLASEPDRKAIESLTTEANLRVLPNGVDTLEFSPDHAHEVSDAEPEIVFHGNMRYAPNVDSILHFFRDAFPVIRAKVPSARLTIVGKTPPREVSALGRDPGVSVTGFVPDIRPYLARASVVIAPIRYAAGTRVKILEAMAMAKPVVATTVGAEGLEVTPGADILLADSPAAFAAAVVSLLTNPDLRRQIGDKARALVEGQYRWDFITSRAESDLLELIPK